MNKPAKSILAVLPVLLAALCTGCSPSRPKSAETAVDGVDTRVVSYLRPTRIVWKNSSGTSTMENEELLLKNNYGQAVLSGVEMCHLVNGGGGMNSILLDFGKEIQGGIQLVTGMSPSRTVKVRIRFGESAEEAMCEIDALNGATNDHAMRDFTIELPWLGITEAGCSGFRFARIDLLGEDTDLLLQEVRAAFRYRDIPYLGSFRCSDKKLEEIWKTGAYTVHLNMQQYLWDGIKRDRLVWTGDINPEVMTIASVFGDNDIVDGSLDLARDIYKPDEWMGGISSYDIWWLITNYQWYIYTGDRAHLDEQEDYATQVLEHLLEYVGEDGYENLPARFLDWPSSENREGISSGLQALLAIGFDCGARVETLWGNEQMVQKCSAAAASLKAHPRDFNGSKQAAALNVLAGMADPKSAAEGTILPGGAKGFSTFYGYYMLEALARAGEYGKAIEIIDQYWGGMLDLGATTFWEDFDIDWMENAARIDDLVPEGKIDVHRSYGNYCYKGYRHSFCHGWASGPTAWISANILGIRPLEPGCRKLEVNPHLGGLEWAEGTFPTPYGVVEVSARKAPDGRVKTRVKAPRGVRIVRGKS